jgi:hypothetical protein
MAVEPELLQAGEEFLEVLLAEMAEHEFARDRGAAPADERQHEPRHQRVVQHGYRPVARHPGSATCVKCPSLPDNLL